MEKNSLTTLRDGGISIHTTEYNLDSNEDTVEMDHVSVYRKKDILQLIAELESEGHYVYPMDWHIGSDVADKFVDLPPPVRKGMHLRLMIEQYVCTSVGIIIKKHGRV